MTKDDPVVARVREARRRILEECGGDFHRVMERAKKIEAEGRYRVVGYDDDRAFYGTGDTTKPQRDPEPKDNPAGGTK